MSPTLSNKKCIVDGAPSTPSQEGFELRVQSRESTPSQEGFELRVQSREEDILRELGILHLTNKVTRPRLSDEDDATILKEAGISYLESTADKESDASKENRDEKKQTKEKNKTDMKPLTRKEAQILRKAGVTWLDNMALIYDDDTIYHKLGCDTVTTAPGTVVGDASTVNSTYAERELMRRLKHGWSTAGDDCAECGMPIICKSRGNGLLECVICGVLDGEEEDKYSPAEDVEAEDHFDCDDAVLGTIHEIVENHQDNGVFRVGTNMSTITPSFEPSEGYGLGKECEEEVKHCQKCHAFIEEEFPMGEGQNLHCRSCAKEDADSAAYNEELGRRLFDGYELTSMNCKRCNLPLISEYQGAPIICLRCG